MALDRGRVIEDVFLSQAQPMSAPFFPTMFGADPSIAPYPFDLARAAKLLDEAGHPTGAGGRFADRRSSRSESQRTPMNEQMFALFRHDLASIGVDLKVEYLQPRDYFRPASSCATSTARSSAGCPTSRTPTPTALLHSSQIKAGRTQLRRLRRRRGRQAARRGRASPPTATSARRSTTSSTPSVHADVPYTVLYAPYAHYAWSRRVHGVHPEDIGPQPRFPGLSAWWVDR